MFNDDQEPITDDDVVYVMARFGLSLLHAMDKFNKNNYYHDSESLINGNLRIGNKLSINVNNYNNTNNNIHIDLHYI